MNRFDCPVCRKVFSTPHGRDSHLGRCIQGGQLQERARLAAQPAVQRLELAGADAAKEELQRAADSSNLQTYTESAVAWNGRQGAEWHHKVWS